MYTSTKYIRSLSPTNTISLPHLPIHFRESAGFDKNKCRDQKRSSVVTDVATSMVNPQTHTNHLAWLSLPGPWSPTLPSSPTACFRGTWRLNLATWYPHPQCTASTAWPKPPEALWLLPLGFLPETHHHGDGFDERLAHRYAIGGDRDVELQTVLHLRKKTLEEKKRERDR